MDATFILIVLFIFTLIHLYNKRSRNTRFPRGPPSIPLIGSYPFLSGVGIEKFIGDSIKKYGALTGLYMGTNPAVIINDWKIAKRLFAKDEFCGRVKNYTTEWARSMGGENLGIVTTDGDRWNTQRTFAMKQLKIFGLSKKHLDVTILPQAKESIQYLESKGDRVEINSTVFAVPVLNVLWSMMTGISLERDNVEMVELLNGLNFLFSSKVFLMSMMLPWIRFVFPNLTGYNRRVNTLKSIQAMLKRIIKEHQDTLDENDPRDMIDAFLVEINSQKDPEFSVDQLVMTCLDLMAAGSETTSTTLQWIVEYMVLYPEVQEACYKEIQENIKESDVRLEDTDSLNYCQAVIAEVQRLSAVAVASVQHTTTQQVEVEGYVLPKDCVLLSNLKLFMTNPGLWVEPLQFNPSRFLNEAGEFTKPEYFVPFGHGKRVCMGENLAKSELIVFTVTLIQQLKFESIPGFEPDVNNYTAGFTRIPSVFNVKISRR